MYPRADIIIFGLWDGFSYSKDDYFKINRDVRPITMGAQFNELVGYLMKSSVANDVEVKFIDLMVDPPGSYYGMVKNALDAGYRLPLVMINERIMFTGGIPVHNIYNRVKFITENGCMLYY